MQYYVYMGMLAVFCTNAINILAGINGLEVWLNYFYLIGTLSYFNDHFIKGRTVRGYRPIGGGFQPR